LRGVRYPKRLVNSVARDPDDPIGCIDHQRHRVAIAPCHFAIHEKVLQFLPAGQPDLIHLLPPAPEASSAEQRRDLNAVLTIQKTRTPEQEKRATEDAQASVFRFADVLGSDFSEAKVPQSVRNFLAKVQRETTRPVNLVKDCWERPRPFAASSDVHPVGNMQETTRNQPNAANIAPHDAGSLCRPAEANAPYSYSYPSGHSTFGTMTAILLAAMIPEKRNALYQRGWEYGRNRVVLGVHFPSDVEAGRIDATAMAGLMMQNPDFQTDLAVAKAELRQVLGLPN
jgi:acid phosphatase (class A)